MEVGLDVTVELPYQRRWIFFQRVLLLIWYTIVIIFLIAAAPANVEDEDQYNALRKYLFVEKASAFYLLISIIISYKAPKKGQKTSSLTPIYWFACFDMLILGTGSSGAGAAGVQFSSNDYKYFVSYASLTLISIIQIMAILYHTIWCLAKMIPK